MDAMHSLVSHPVFRQATVAVSADHASDVEAVSSKFPAWAVLEEPNRGLRNCPGDGP